MRLLTVILFAGVLATAASGCASKASDEECKAACDNVAAVTLGDVDDVVKKDPELSKAGAEGEQLVKRVVTGMQEEIKVHCMERCKQKASSEQAQCIAAATTLDNLVTCK